MNILRCWAQQLPRRLPEHYVFTSKKTGAAGSKFDAKVYATDPTKTVGTIKEVWGHGQETDLPPLSPFEDKHLG